MHAYLDDTAVYELSEPCIIPRRVGDIVHGPKKDLIPDIAAPPRYLLESACVRVHFRQVFVEAGGRQTVWRAENPGVRDEAHQVMADGVVRAGGVV